MRSEGSLRRQENPKAAGFPKSLGASQLQSWTTRPLVNSSPSDLPSRNQRTKM